MPLKMCEKHWEECREAIKKRGLWHLVPESAIQAINKIMKKITPSEKEESLRNTYDPLLDLHMMITAQAIHCGGIQLLFVTENKCPLCEAEYQTQDTTTGSEWINGASDAILKYCEENNLQG